MTDEYQEQYNQWVSKLNPEFIPYIKENKDIAIALAKFIEATGKNNLKALVNKTGLARETVYKKLRFLVKAGLLRREQSIIGRGRPAIIYYRTNMSLENPKNDYVKISFSVFQHYCTNHRRDNICSFGKIPCNSKACKLVSKIESK